MKLTGSDVWPVELAMSIEAANTWAFDPVWVIHEVNYIYRDAAHAWNALKDGLDGTTKQWMAEAALARAIERAAGELPEGHMISVHVERGAGWVEATITSEGGPDMTLAEQVNALVDAACAAGAAR